jgi:hypothetical protein
MSQVGVFGHCPSSHGSHIGYDLIGLLGTIQERDGDIGSGASYRPSHRSAYSPAASGDEHNESIQIHHVRRFTLRDCYGKRFPRWLAYR